MIRFATALGTAAVLVVGGILALNYIVNHQGLNEPGATSNPEPSIDLGVFRPVVGRIVYQNETGIWAVDPASSDPTATVQLTSGPSTPLGWSSDGTRLLIQKGSENLFVLHANGSETQVTDQLSGFRDIPGAERPSGATISPDGSRVVFAALTKPWVEEHSCQDGALFAVDADGGPAELLWESQSHGTNGIVSDPAFSPDGTQIAFVDGYCDTGRNVWVMNADGTDAHQIVSSETNPPGGGHVHGLAWSAAGDRIALAESGDLYTFAPDGSGFMQIAGADTSCDSVQSCAVHYLNEIASPYWSPDGSQIAYTTGCVDGLPFVPGSAGCMLVIADADGSNLREFTFATSGPWHPGTPAPTQMESPTTAQTLPPSPTPSATVQATLLPSPTAAFSSASFADISLDPVSDQRAAEFQAILATMARGGGMTATLMTAEGTWSGATGKADNVNDVLVDSQFGIASVTKSVIAAQVMKLVEAGELSLDDAATDHLPADFAFDINGATIRQLLNMHAGIPDWYSDAMELQVATSRTHVWTPDEVLALVGPSRRPAGEDFAYTDTNYNLLGLVIEHIRQRPLVDVLRDGVLRVEGAGRLIYQPDESPTDPMAMPRGEPRTSLETSGGYLPSLADASSAGPAGAMASDAISLAHWWRAFCAGEIVSETSLVEMSTFVGGADGYGLGLFNPADPWAAGVGHVGSNFGYVSWAGCLTDEQMIVVVLTNQAIDDISGLARPLVMAARSN